MILGSSLAACMILALVLPFLGQKVLERRIVFVDLALAQIAATGYAVGLASGGYAPVWAGVVTLVSIAILAWLPNDTHLPKEAVMGAIYAVAAATGMIFLASLPHAEGHMTDLMFGSLLGVNAMDIILLATCGVLAVACIRFSGGDTYGQRLLFYVGLALAIVPAIHAVGVILVFAMLLLPALAVWKNGYNGPLIPAIALAVTGVVGGIMSADRLDLPPSSSVVLALGLIALFWQLIPVIKRPF